MAISNSLRCQITSILDSLPDTLVQSACTILQSLMQLPNTLVHLSHCLLSHCLLCAKHLKAAPST